MLCESQLGGCTEDFRKSHKLDSSWARLADIKNSVLSCPINSDVDFASSLGETKQRLA